MYRRYQRIFSLAACLRMVGNAMSKYLQYAFFSLVLSADTALGDWHHHSSGSGGAPDPHFEAFMATSLIVLGVSLAILFIGGPILVTRTRRIRDLFWVIPLFNIAFYLLSIGLRPYPGGFAARFQSPGMEHTLLEIAFLLIASLAVALVLAAVQWLKRTRRRFFPGRSIQSESERS